MVEYSFKQLACICTSIVEFIEDKRVSKDELEHMSVKLIEPSSGGELRFELNFNF